MRWQFIEVPFFMRRRDDHFAGDDDFADFQQSLAANPGAGDEIQGTGGLRKVRWGDRRRGKGKRGGRRVIYLACPADSRAAAGLIFLLHVYSKSMKADLTASEKKALKELATELKAEIRLRRGKIEEESGS